MKKLIAAILAIAMLGMMVAGCSSVKANTPNTSPLKVGMELAYPPFETKDDQGNPAGVSVEFAKALGTYLGRPVQIENIAWDGLIPSLQTGKVDVVISSMTIRADRLKEIDFSKPYAKALLALLTNKNSNINTIDDLNQAGKKIAVKTGTTGYLYAQDKLKNAEIIALADESACVTEVTQGKADAFIYDQLTIYRNQKANPDTTKAVYIPNQSVEYWGAGVKKGNTELLDKVNAFIDKFYAEKGFDPITQKYLADEKKAFDQLGFDWFFTNVQK
jgi:polar amino acid transport system substrate-binding protein